MTLDVTGVGELVRIAAERGRATRPGLKLGICGEHGGDPASIAFCETVGLDYVSCSPYRVPIARLAAAQAVLSGESGAGRHDAEDRRQVCLRRSRWSRMAAGAQTRAGAVAGAHDLFGPDPRAGGAADQSRPGDRAAVGPLAVADRARADLPDPASARARPTRRRNCPGRSASRTCSPTATG